MKKTIRKELGRLMMAALAMMSSSAEAKVWMPQMFQNSMVIQRQQMVPVWGTATAGETVTVTFRGKSVSTTAAPDGKWRIDLAKQKPGGPFVMTVRGSAADDGGKPTEIIIKDVLVGDVWIVSGQSNIDTHLERIYPQYPKEIDTYQNDKVRLFRVFTNPQTEHQQDVLPTAWKTANKENAWHFSAVGYFLGQMMFNDTKVPQGIIQTSQGGTPVQSWIDIDSLKNIPLGAAGSGYYEKYRQYTDPEYIALMGKANARGSELWNAELDANDKGVGVYEKEGYDDSKWLTVNQYDNGKWAAQQDANGGLRPIIGSMWLRQHITVDKAHAGKAATMHLGTLHDMDHTYVNGKHVGTTYYQYPPRRYRIPAGLLHEGDNVITMRVICKSGQAFFYKDKPHQIVFDDAEKDAEGKPLEALPLSYNWKTMIGANMLQGPLGGPLDTQNQASVLFNGMVHPLAPYAMQGVVWYQGESNTGKSWEYGDLLTKMMGNWRCIWNRPTLPFNIVQLVNHMEPSAQPQNSGWAVLREEQRRVADRDPYANLTVGIDLGEASDIHPLRKKEITQRVVMGLQNMVFGKKNILAAEPKEATINTDGTIAISMTEALAPQAELGEFEVSDASGKFHNAKASTDGNTITVTPPAGIKVTAATKVRYAWKDNPVKANLRGVTGLPASPFQLTVNN